KSASFRLRNVPLPTAARSDLRLKAVFPRGWCLHIYSPLPFRERTVSYNFQSRPDCAWPNPETDPGPLANRRPDHRCRLGPRPGRRPTRKTSIFVPCPGAFSARRIRSREFFSCFSNRNHGDVVVLRGRTDEVSQIIDQPRNHRLRALFCAGLNRSNRSLQSKFVPFVIEGLS